MIMIRTIRFAFVLGILGTLGFSSTAMAASAAELDVRVAEAVESFKENVNGAEVFLAQAQGYLVFPKVYKAGFIFGG
jgi:lipid-binding SYLF domain-containing protein